MVLLVVVVVFTDGDAESSGSVNVGGVVADTTDTLLAATVEIACDVTGVEGALVDGMDGGTGWLVDDWMGRVDG